jgi:hypothetical protein
MRPALLLPLLALAATFAIEPQSSRAQQPQAPAAAPVKPYPAIAVTPPQPYSDPSFAAFRKQLADIVQRKDRAALAKLVVPQGFFWMQDKDLADKRKSGIDNLAKAVDLDAKDGSGWNILAVFASDTTGIPLPNRKGVICAPADPQIDPKAFQSLVSTTQTQPADWAYPTQPGVAVRKAAEPNAGVVEKLGMNLVRVLSEGDSDQQAFLHVATPSGKTGFVPVVSISSLGGDEICYVKGASDWKITGYFGGAGE